MIPTIADIAWLAGIFDADGSLARGSRPNGSHYWQFRIAMTHEATIDRCSDILHGLGISHGLRQFTAKSVINKGSVAFAVESGKRDSVVALSEVLSLYSITKRDRMQECIAEMSDRASHASSPGVRNLKKV